MQGSLYPALHRLERRGWLRAKWATTENNRKTKYYEITAAGRKQQNCPTQDEPERGV
ncbi:MAG TPA: helix-turn-helix transcriptional regulator [Bryobacteraceae bacterium]|nr:helix-turn-helix transcriptional regulator [Bryobacteraceae bacterium]